MWHPTDASEPIYGSWRDTMLDTDCEAGVAADGVERCVPQHAHADTLFSDPACTQPVAFVPAAPCGHDTYAFGIDGANLIHVFPIGAVYSGPVYDSRIGCAPAAMVNGTLYSVGAEVPPTTFVTDSYEQVTPGTYQHLVRTFADGARLELPLLLLPAGQCEPTGGVLGPTACQPSVDPRVTPVYADAACTQRAYLWARGAGDTSTATEIYVDDQTICGSSGQVLAVNADVTAPSYYARDITGCTQTATPANAVLYTAALVQPYPSGNVAPGPRRGRLGNLYWTPDDGIGLAIATWDYDTGHTCFPFLGDDGVFRCLPRRPLLVTACPDGDCSGATETLAAACLGSAPTNGAYYPSCDDGPMPVTAMPSAGPAASVVEEGTCTPLALPPGGAFSATPGAALPAAMFPALVETIE